MVLHDVRYDGRPLFYRMALSDMNVPYADPRPHYHKKAAFDLGDAGAGLTANDLYVISSSIGDVIEKNNCVCIHEQDYGIGWKHTNYRTGNASVVRARELVLQSIMTVSNYEYILMFIFTQAGDVVYEVRATGILSTQPIDEGVQVPWGTVVHPGVLAAHHQHIFSLRVDPMIDGPNNTFSYDECVPLPRDAHLNPHGTGYITKETQISTSGGYDLDMSRNRVFKIKNNDVRNPINQEAVGFKVSVPDYQK
ncbi:hypothetical protein PV10_03673 [Exophiala mesophila]|uniref:Amine oxidase n=1 Tax=Exophiala mesophila TaxID=212818 RepID=A0A0D1X2X6_EXOME|nr:uncharacterized protein PV10_03673 [Exophiala mesophila]KIV96095.1 hypothetical protein PV10_03673 [Exophiala mesophila]